MHFQKLNKHAVRRVKITTRFNKDAILRVKHSRIPKPNSDAIHRVKTNVKITTPRLAAIINQALFKYRTWIFDPIPITTLEDLESLPEFKTLLPLIIAYTKSQS